MISTFGCSRRGYKILYTLEATKRRSLPTSLSFASDVSRSVIARRRLSGEPIAISVLARVIFSDSLRRDGLVPFPGVASGGEAQANRRNNMSKSGARYRNIAHGAMVFSDQTTILSTM